MTWSNKKPSARCVVQVVVNEYNAICTPLSSVCATCELDSLHTHVCVCVCVTFEFV